MQSLYIAFTSAIVCNAKDLTLVQIAAMGPGSVFSLFFFPLLQRASFSLRVSVMKGKNLMAKDANGKVFW